MSGEFDVKKKLYTRKFEGISQILINLSFQNLCGSKLSGLRPFDNADISMS